jgi:hypothetical protein
MMMMMMMMMAMISDQPALQPASHRPLPHMISLRQPCLYCEPTKVVAGVNFPRGFGPLAFGVGVLVAAAAAAVAAGTVALPLGSDTCGARGQAQ